MPLIIVFLGFFCAVNRSRISPFKAFQHIPWNLLSIFLSLFCSLCWFMWPYSDSRKISILKQPCQKIAYLSIRLAPKTLTIIEGRSWLTSIEDFNIRLSPDDLTCTEILVGHFHCDICFNQIENSLTSYDGSKFYFAADLPAEIMKECILLISKMRMGSFEHYKFLELLTKEKTD